MSEGEGSIPSALAIFSIFQSLTSGTQSRHNPRNHGFIFAWLIGHGNPYNSFFSA
jgi:hypothetical protein